MDILHNIGDIATLIADLSKDGSIADVADLISKLSKNGSLAEVASLIARISKDDSLRKYIEDLINDTKGPKEKKEDSKDTSEDSSSEDTINFPAGNDVVTDLSYLHPKIQSAVEDIQQQVDINIIETFRTPERQDKLYALGRTEGGQIVTKARSFESYHNYGLALDVAPVNDKIVQIFESHGFEWGGRWKTFKDTPHFQMTFGLSVSQLKALYDKGNLQAIWDHIGYL